VAAFRQLVEALPAERPVYALQARGLERGQRPQRTVPAMARHYLEAIRAVQPCGPYHVAGWSFGGLVAYEMVRLLRQRGEAATLFVIDSNAPGANAAPPLEDDLEALRQMVALYATAFEADVPSDASSWPSAASFEDCVTQAVAAGVFPPAFGPEDARRMVAVFRACDQAANRYRPTIARGEAMLFVAVGEEHDDRVGDLGWSRWLKGDLELLCLPTSHLGIMAAPYVGEVARAINARLQS
jgi:thioesterase domain-containing protein